MFARIHLEHLGIYSEPTWEDGRVCLKLNGVTIFLSEEALEALKALK